MSNGDYTNIDALKIALNLEKDGYDFYTAVAAKATDEKVKKIFLMLANEEKKHLSLIRKIQDGLIDPLTYFISDEVLVEEYLRRIIEKKVFSESKDIDDIMEKATVEDAIILAMQAEKDSRDFFFMMSELTKDHEGQVTFLQLSRFEENHLIELERLRDYIARQANQ
ncbi:MAG: ferritin family protein [Nitrospirae bacterium]|nr:ferritin family protein [Nitrospirota bacterium]